MGLWRFCSIFILSTSLLRLNDHVVSGKRYVSAVGNPGMRRNDLRVAIEAWNQCNEVGEEAPGMGSPRMADCFHIHDHRHPVTLIHKVSEEENKLGYSNTLHHKKSARPIKAKNANDYAAKKEIYLGEKCQNPKEAEPWQFWMIMLKSGNMDTEAAMCPVNGKKSKPFPQDRRFPCFGKGCMNMPLMYHNPTRSTIDDKGRNMLKGGFYGTWDLDGAGFAEKMLRDRPNTSFYSVSWEREYSKVKGSYVFHHVLRTSEKYPWLMLYLRSDATRGFSGGYHYDTRGMSKIIPKSPDFKVIFTLDIKKGGGKNSQFYLMDIGSCWKNNGKPCDGDVTTDVTRYSEMIINPETTPWCKQDDLKFCPYYHTFANGTRVSRTNKEHFPYDAYHLHCFPGNAGHLVEPYDLCDPYSNPQAQEIVQILPHPVWGEYGYPTTKGEGWIGDSRTWELDVGRLSHSLYFYQDPETDPVERYWPSVDLGTEIYISNDEVAEWTVTDFDIIIPEDKVPKNMRS